MTMHQTKSTDLTPGTQRLRGVMAPVLTPLRADLSPDVQKWIGFAKSDRKSVV